MISTTPNSPDRADQPRDQPRDQRPKHPRVVIGGGIVGLATAWRWIQSQPGMPVHVIEAESEISTHQSGHNSGVLHSGIYYRPGSEKAILCREGKQEMEAFCDENAISWDRCGKVIVATHQDELESLERIAERGQANEVAFERINTDRLRQLEPSVAGIAAMHVPGTGIVNYRHVCAALRDKLIAAGGAVRVNQRVVRIDYEDRTVRIGFADGSHCHAGEVIVCGGLHSDSLYQMALTAASSSSTRSFQPNPPSDQDVRIIPFRGEYFQLVPARRGLCRNLIYPVPDPRYPFLGVHFTRMIDGHVECGPNAVLALSRNGYDWGKINPGEVLSTVGFAGFRKFAAQHWRMGLSEMHRSFRKSVFVRSLQRLIPEIAADDLVRARAGVRAQAIRADGTMVDDFLFRRTPRMTHVLNAPSPAATASMAIARRILEVHESGEAHGSVKANGFEEANRPDGVRE